MIIKSLRLKNIRSYQDQIITFPTGSVLLSGDIGSGKSTILLAIEFALFGTDLDRLSANALLRKGENQGQVELDFQLKDQDITIKRTLKRGKTSIQQTAGYIVTNGTKQDLMPAEIKAKIIELLGYPPELAAKKKNYVFCYTVYTPQEDMKEILTDDEESRLNTLRKIFNMDKYKKIKENCLIYIKELRSKRKELQIKTEDLEDLKKQLTEKQELLTQHNQQLTELTPKINSLETEIQKIKQNLEELEKKIKQLNEWKKQLEVLQAQEKVKAEQKNKNQEKINKIQNQLQQIPRESLEQLQNQIIEDEKLIIMILEKKTTLTTQFNNIRYRIQELEQEIQNNNQKIKDLPNQKQRIQELKTKIQDIQDFKNKKQELENSLNKLNLALKEYEVNKQHSQTLKTKILQFSKCPTCYQIVSKDHKQKINKEEGDKIVLCEKRIQDCLQQRQQNQLKLQAMGQAIEKTFEHEKEYERIKTEIKNLEETNKHLQDKITELQNKKTQSFQLEKDLDEVNKTNLEQKQEQIKQNKEILDKLKEKQKLEQDLRELENHNQEIDRDIQLLLSQKTELKLNIGLNEKAEQEYQENKTSLEQKQENKNQFSLDQIKLETEIKNLQDNLEALNNEIQAKDQIKQTLQKIKETTNWLSNHFMNLMTNIEKHVMARIQQEFNELFKEWFSMLLEDENISAKLDDSFNPIIEQDGYEVDLKHLSGGERTSTALAYRLALNKVVNDVVSSIKTKDILILDEPTDGFSSQQLDKVRDVLEQLGVKQTIIVSHENKIESFVSNVIRIHKREGISEVI
ncbi:MAG: SMC family ATPase [Nanoarchaeota archaeon]|nr:SMC family ATPase [Nanoarchaeota archaeon]